ncbi:MAG: PD40 domain-containing protein, partial [Pseudomonadota bacterium]
GKPEIFIQELVTGKIERLTTYRGLNNAPAWSPDGKQLAMTLSKDGNAEIYLYELTSKRLRRVTRNYAIDTEPTWLPDGSGLLFTSDRGGTPQIYRVELGGDGAGRTSRITFEGSYNARAAVSYDGRYIAMVHRARGKYRIAVLDSENGRFSVLTDSRLDESPSFAPNASMILYATEAKRRGVLAAVSVDGGAHQKLSVSEGDIREPVWSPFKDASR